MMRSIAPLLVALLLTACAQVRELHGGEKDTEAPVLLAAQPPNGTIHFQSERIVLRFNERVKLDRVRDRLLISPPLDRTPDVTVRGGEDVVIDLRAPLAPNTTYTFNIGEAVTDITESNAAGGLTYVISTGDFLDSLQMHGSVIDAFTDQPEPDMLVVLHADTDTAGFSRGRPAYFTRTDKQGGFVLRNLREGRYRIHALQDQNANFKNDLPNERVAFLDTRVHPVDSTAHVLRVFLPLASVQQVKEAVVQPERSWRLVFARPIDTLSLTSIDRTGGVLEWRQERNTTLDTILFWPSDTTLLSGQRFEVRDASGIIDTLTYRPARKMPFNLDVKYLRGVEDRITFLASRPVRSIDQQKVIIHIDSNSITTDHIETVLDIDTIDPRRLTLAMNLALDRKLALELLPGAVTDIYGGSNDTLRLAFGSVLPQETGDLRVNLTADSLAPVTGPFFLQLLNSQGGVLRTLPVPALPFRADLPATPSGVYTLKLVRDEDGDGRWSTGSLREHRQPERVFRQGGEVNVRAGWEVVVDWRVPER